MLQLEVGILDRMTNASTRSRYSRLNDWKNTIYAIEMKRFLGIIYLIGIHSLPELTQYWSNDFLYKTTAFSAIMSRDRFHNILKCWHFSDNDAEYTNRLYKV